MGHIYNNINKYNPGKRQRILVVPDDMTADIVIHKKHNPIVIKLFIRGRKLNIYLVFITQAYFEVSKDIRRNLKHYFIMKIPNK